MIEVSAPSRIAATDIVTGRTVYLGRNGDWTPDPAHAVVVEDGRMAGLYLLDAEACAHEVSAPRLAAARDLPGRSR